MDKRQVTIAVMLMAVIAVIFWTQSRLPALDEKAQMGQRVTMSAIAFDVILPVHPDQPFVERIVKSAANWGYTNWKGMTFGVLFASAFFTLIQLFPRNISSRSRLLNALKGLFIGVPLGVCANCSTPIAHGMIKAGARVETALATLISSPTLNIFVLTMTFSLLPFHLAVIKLLGVLFLVIVVIPFVVKQFISEDSSPAISLLENEASTAMDSAEGFARGGLNPGEVCKLPATNWFNAISMVAVSYVRSLYYICKTTVPLMVLAGFLGAAVIEVIPFGALQSLQPLGIGLIAVALIGVFLPVPIAFDVIIATTLLASGLPVAISMVLLFSLGAFSIYPAMVVAKNVSVKLSVSLFIATALVAVLAGVVAHYYEVEMTERTSEKLSESANKLNENQKEPIEGGLPSAIESSDVNTAADKAIFPDMTGRDEELVRLARAQCQFFEVEESRQRCVADTVSFIEAHKVLPLEEKVNSDYCNTLSPKQKIIRCYSLEAKQQAVEKGDLNKCELITFEDIKSDCRRRVVIQKTKALFSMFQINRDDIFSENDKKNVKEVSISDQTEVRVLPKNQNQSKNDFKIIASFEGVEIAEMTLRPSTSELHSKKPFLKVSASKLGIDLPVDFTEINFVEPFKYGRGIASGDINNDGFFDVIYGTSNGVTIYKNIDGKSFVREPFDLSGFEWRNTFLVVLADLDNDGWQDIFFTTYGGTNYIAYNDEGVFKKEAVSKFESPKVNLTMAAGLIDKDRDGDLDIFLGNWSTGQELNFDASYSQNQWMINNGNSFDFKPDEAVVGETLTVLMSDYIGDDKTDMIVGNDEMAPDLFYRATDQGFTLIKPEEGVVPVTTLTTMSIDSADINNDLKLDLFSADMSFLREENPNYCSFMATDELKNNCERNLASENAIEKNDTDWCLKYTDKARAKDCISAIATRLAKQSKNIDMCNYISKDVVTNIHLCRRISEKPKQVQFSLRPYIPQRHFNNLLVQSSDGKFEDKTDLFGVKKSYWSWNAKFADLDNDEWQDLYVANGFGFGGRRQEVHSNVFFHNDGGGAFKRSEEGFGLVEFLNVPSYTYVDFDNDGDIDIFYTTVLGKPKVFINNASQKKAANSIQFSFDDFKGNRFCIGCKVMINYGGGKSQMREIKMSGGFLSFDAPIVYFGLGDQTEVDSVSVQWSDGERSILKNKFEAGSRYEVKRLQ